MKTNNILLSLAASGALAAIGLSSSNAEAQSAQCSYTTVWGVVSSNLGDPAGACNEANSASCDLWVYELAYSTDSSCAPFVTALRRVTKTPGVGEIAARMADSQGQAPRGFAYTRVGTGNTDYDRLSVETRGRDDADFYGFAITSSTAHAKTPVLDAPNQQVLFTKLLSGGGTQSGSIAAGNKLGGTSFSAQADTGIAAPAKGKPYYTSLSTTSRFQELDQAGKCGTLTETRSVSHDGLVLYNVACRQAGVAQNSKVFLGKSGSSAVTDLSDLIERYAAEHRVFQTSQAAADRLDFYTGDFLRDTLVAQPRTRIVVALGSHNEEESEGYDGNDACAPLITSQLWYKNNRDLSVDLASMVVSEDAAWDLQTDWTYMYVSNHIDPADASWTPTSTVLQYIETSVAPGRVAVEPHTHDDSFDNGESPYDHNYGDIAYWFQTLGLTQSGVVGGFDFVDDTVTLASPVVPSTETSPASWQASILTYASHTDIPTLPKHCDGCDTYLSGIWRPAGDGVFLDSTSDFFQHDPAGTLIHVGVGKRSYQGVLTLLMNYSSLTPNIYPAHIFFNQCELTLDQIAALRLEIIALRPHVIDGELIWGTVNDAVAHWQSQFAGQPSCFDPGDTNYDCGF